MSKTTVKSHLLDETAQAELNHELSMSKNEVEACFGRLVKLLTPVLDQFLEAERKRGTHPINIIMNAAPLGITSLFYLLPPHIDKNAEGMLKTIKQDLLSKFDEAAPQYLDIVKEQS